MATAPLDLLIFNPPSEEFPYVPVGTFALCDWLNRQGQRVRVVNLGQVSRSEAHAQIDRAMESSAPRNVGIILNWKETLSGFLAVGDKVHRTWPGLPVWTGGLTAGFYAEELLLRAGFLHGVVRGDSEIPVQAICSREELSAIPNLWTARGGSVQGPRSEWWADEAFLDSLHYGELSVLDDVGRYLELVDSRLGLPLAPGRGCRYDCGYCGGSRSAFQRHSGRPRLALRSPARVVRDLERAFSCGARTFLLSHTAAVCDTIVAELAARYAPPLPFTLHLELWDTPSRGLLYRYVDLGVADGLPPRQVLLSMHGCSTQQGREKERRALLGAADFLHDVDRSVVVTLFSGFYTPWQQTRRSLDAELKATIEMRMGSGCARVHSAFMALSTDPGSRWSLARSSIASQLSLQNIASGAMSEGAVFNNLLLHRPRRLPPSEDVSFQRAWHLDGILFDSALAVWALMNAVLSFEQYRTLLDVAGRGCYCTVGDRVYPTSDDILAVALANVVDHLEGQPACGEDGKGLVRELTRLFLAAVVARAQSPQKGGSCGCDHLPGFLTLNPTATFVSKFDFDPVRVAAESECRVSAIAIEECLSSRGTYGYLLIPEVSCAQSAREMSLLAQFDGVTHTDFLVHRLGEELGAPFEMVRGRVRDLWSVGVLRCG